MKQYNVMLKPASSLCNLRCRYCFYCDVADLREVRSFGIMTDETMQNVLRSLERSLSPGDQITIIFQGGEPMLAGLDFYRRFAVRTDGWDPGISVSFALQTNGMLLDHDWCAFLKERRVLVGLSYDLVDEAHDLARVDAAGKPTSRSVADAMALLRREEVDMNILCTLTNPIARHPQKIWRRMEQLDVRFVQFTPCLDALETPGESQYALTPKRFAGFYNTLFPLWLAAYQKGQYRSVKLFDDVIHRLGLRLMQYVRAGWAVPGAACRGGGWQRVSVRFLLSGRVPAGQFMREDDTRASCRAAGGDLFAAPARKPGALRPLRI